VNKRVYAVVVSYNAREDTLASIRSLRSLEGLSGIIVVDNASSDGIDVAVGRSFRRRARALARQSRVWGRRLKATQYRSAASFETPYGEIGSVCWDSRHGRSRTLPYTDDELANTARRTPWSRAASNTLSVPSTLSALVVKGSCTERGTDGKPP
jgi:hypothetical protein